MEVDYGSGAVYIRFARRGVKAVKTLVRSEWPHVAVDLDRDGEVIGVEALGMRELTIGPILEKAKVRANEQAVQAARYFRVQEAVAA